MSGETNETSETNPDATTDEVAQRESGSGPKEESSSEDIVSNQLNEATTTTVEASAAESSRVRPRLLGSTMPSPEPEPEPEPKPEGPIMKWYVVQAYSGYENKVKLSLEERIKQAGMEDALR